MRARVVVTEGHYIPMNTGAIEVHCLSCNRWVKLDEVRTETYPEDGCQVSVCPACGADSQFEKDGPNLESGRRSQFELTPTEARDKILRILSQLPRKERDQAVKELKNVI